MATIVGGIPITSFISPTDDTDTFEVTREEYNKGGYRTVADITERDAITPARRKEGMLVRVLSDSKHYTLLGGIDNVNWSEQTFGSGSASSKISVNQIGHSFVIGDIIRATAVDSVYTKAQADSVVNAEVVGIVTEYTDANNFGFTYLGEITLSGLTPNTIYYLDPLTAGAYTNVEPTSIGQVIKPLFVAVSASQAIFYNMRGNIIGVALDHSTIPNRDLGNNHTILLPATDSTSALRITQADQTPYVTFDSINKAIGINANPLVGYSLNLTGNSSFDKAYGSGSITDPTQLVTKQYAESLINSAFIESIKAVPVSNIVSTSSTPTSLINSGGFPSTIDDVPVSSGDRILLVNQTNKIENGWYSIVDNNTWNRLVEADTGSEIINKKSIIISGTIYKESLWYCTNSSVTLGVTPINFSRVAGGVTSHDQLSNLTLGDDHTQYLLLSGRTGGQIIYGGLSANDKLVLHSTVNATKGDIELRGAKNKVIPPSNILDAFGVYAADGTTPVLTVDTLDSKLTLSKDIQLTSLSYEYFPQTQGQDTIGDVRLKGDGTFEQCTVGAGTLGGGTWITKSTDTFYTGTAERTVGGITDGDIFTAQTMTQMWDKLIKQEKFPVLTAPSATFVSSVTGFREVGELILTLTFTSSFNRGSINPQYTALNAFRSGLPNTYQYTGSGLSNNPSTTLTDIQTLNNYVVLINGQSWTGSVAYDAGVQPKSSYDNDYMTPLSAGSTGVITRTITGVYPTFATTVNITVMTKQALASHTSTYIEFVMVAEDAVNKQTADLPTAWSSITGIQFYNTVSSAWEWINGSKANSLTTFTVTSVTNTVQGSIINYNRFTHNGSQTGNRTLRFYTT